jgi:Type II secretion system (T2SS), protein F
MLFGQRGASTICVLCVLLLVIRWRRQSTVGSMRTFGWAITRHGSIIASSIRRLADPGFRVLRGKLIRVHMRQARVVRKSDTPPSRSSIRQRRRDVMHRRMRSRAIPDLIDLIRLSLVAGCSTHTAFVLLGDHSMGVLRDDLRNIASNLQHGIGVAESLELFLNEIGDAARPLCSALLASERYGLSLSATLETLALDARLARQRDTEIAARRLPVLLLFPLVTCILPAFALLSIVPLLGGGITALRW